MIPFAMMSSKGYFWYLFHCYRWVIYWQVHSLRAIIQALSQVKLFRIKCMKTANKRINLLIDLLYAVHTVCIVLVIAVCVIYVLTHVVLLMSLRPVSFIYVSFHFLFCLLCGGTGNLRKDKGWGSCMGLKPPLVLPRHSPVKPSEAQWAST